MMDPRLDTLRRMLRDSDGLATFRQIMSSLGDVPDDDLPVLIDAFARERTSRRASVRLDEFLDAAPRIREHTDALDMAIHCALRSGQPIEEMRRRHPDLRQPIEESALLDGIVGSTSQAQLLVDVETRQTPCPFGPRDDSGEHRFLLEELLGVGAFGAVYRAIDRRLSHDEHRATVAVKILRRMGNPAAETAFAAEAARARFVVHPNVVQVHDRGVTTEGEHYLVCEYVPGGDLATYAQSRELPLRPRDAVEIMLSIARGVQAAHERGVIHCDLKPSNVLLSSKGEPKVADFGIAVRTGEGAPRSGTEDGRQPLGSLAFMPPERYQGTETRASTNADVYALGGMLFWLLTGALPNGSTIAEIQERLARSNPQPQSPRAVNPRINRDLDAIVRRSMRADPRGRHPTAATLADDLERWLGKLPIEWTRPSPVKRATMWSRRSPVVASLVAIAILGGVGGSGAAIGFGLHAQRKAREAAIERDRADSNLEWRDRSLRFLESVMNTARSTVEDGLFNESFFGFWVVEQWLGPRYYDDPRMVERMWQMRQQIASDTVEFTDARAPGTLVPTIWRTSLGLWQLTENAPEEAAVTLREADDAWRSMLSPDDPWLAIMDGYRACAEIDLAGTDATDASLESARARVERAITVARESLAAVESIEIFEPRLQRADELLAAR